MSVKVPSGTATDAVNGLVEAGLFKSYDDFAALSEQLGLDLHQLSQEPTNSMQANHSLTS